MAIKTDKHPSCFGILNSVFPVSENGLRETPASCFKCTYKTECLKTAMGGFEGIEVHEEILDRAYESGIIGFFGRWSKKKDMHRQKKIMQKNTGEEL